MTYEPDMYGDPNSAIPVAACPHCGGEIYDIDTTVCPYCSKPLEVPIGLDPFPVLYCKEPPVIISNLMDIRKQISEVLATLSTATRDREGLSTVKAIRAQLRKDFDIMEQQRKAVKAAILAPYEKVNEAYQKVVGTPMKEADEACRNFVDTVSGQIKAARLDEMKAYFAELVTARNIPWLTFDKCGVTVTMQSAEKKDFSKEREQMKAFVDRVDEDLRIIADMDNSSEILAVYIRTLNLSQSIATVQESRRRLEEADKINQANRQRMSEQLQHARNIAEAAGVTMPLEKRFTLTFTVRHTKPMLRALKGYLENNNFEIVEE